MHALIAALPAIVVIVTAMIDTVRRFKKSTTAPPTDPAPPVQTPARTIVKVRPPIQTGYAGRREQAALPEHVRAIEGAGSRLASGAEYSSIVAERSADRAAEARFAAQVRVLEDSEPKRAVPSEEDREVRMSALTDLQRRLDRQSGVSGQLIYAVILSEVLGPPRMRRRP